MFDDFNDFSGGRGRRSRQAWPARAWDGGAHGGPGAGHGPDAEHGEDHPHGGRRRDGRGRDRGPRGHGRGEGRDEFGPGFGGFGAEGPFGPAGPFGPGGPFGPAGPFGPGGPFGGGRGRGRGRGPGGGRGRARRGEVRTAALLLIAEEPRNGYQIIQALEERTGGVWRPSPGAIYPALSQLEDEGLVAVTEMDGRKAYRITDAGTQEATAWADRPKPWESEESDEDLKGPATGMMSAMRQVAMAATAVAQSGDQDLLSAAAEILEETRRDLYRLLADGAGTGRDDDGPQDVTPER